MISLLSITPDCENLIEKAGRTCYDSKISNSPDKFIKSILKNNHTSVVEHASATFEISDVSRALTHQLVRSRIASFSQKSQRYVKEDNFEIVIPPSIKNNAEALKEYESIMSIIQNSYNKLIKLGINKEDARFVLPNACKTQIVMTMNFREFLHTLDLRVSKHAQWEIRSLFIDIWKVLYQNAPNVFSLIYFENWSKDFEYKKDIFEKYIIG